MQWFSWHIVNKDDIEAGADKLGDENSDTEDSIDDICVASDAGGVGDVMEDVDRITVEPKPKI